MGHYIIKPPESAEEINGKAYVHYKSWQETYSSLVDDNYNKGVTLEKCIQIAHRRQGSLLIAKDGSKVIGFVGYGPCRDDSFEDYGEIFAIYILKEYFGQKVGYALMIAAFEQLACLNLIVVWVLMGKERSIRFYERYGFHFDGTEKEILLGTPNTELRMLYSRR